MRNKRTLVVTIHSTYLNGGVFDYPVIWEALHGMEYVAIRHSMDGSKNSMIHSGNVEKAPTKMFGVVKKPTFLRYITEFSATLIYFLKLKLVNKSKKILIAVDPLNGLAGAFLRRLHLIDSFAYFNNDYSDWRFKNKALDWFYYQCDYISSSSCDYNCCTADSVVAKKIEKYPQIKNYSNKMVHLPNYPLSLTLKGIEVKKTGHTSFVYVGFVGQQIDFIKVFKFVEDLNKKSKATLEVVGDGPKLEEYRKYVAKNNMEDAIHFHGFLTNKKTLEIIARCHFGFAIYKGEENYDKFRDSAKAREYIALGTVPIISSNIISTSRDILKHNAGIVVDSIDDLDPLIFQNKLNSYANNLKKMYSGKKDCQTEFINQLIK